MEQVKIVVPRPITAGVEMTALARFLPDATWSGQIEEGGMGPGTPPMTAQGRGVHHVIQDGLWIVGDYSQEQYALDGSHVLTWQLHWVVGWDPANHEYRATLADNNGHADVMRGQIDGDRLTFHSLGDGPVRLRLIWDASNPDDLIWTNEASVENGPWTLVETYHMRPTFQT
jgi:hypothetical protein